jgi:hypothetical protein
MSDVVLIAIIAAIPGLAATLLSWKNGARIEQVHKATNSMKDELVASVRKQSRQKGRTDGIREQKNLVARAKRK